MEVAGLIVGIASLAGQSISGILTLKAYFSSYKGASSKVKNLNNEFDDLASTLKNIQAFFECDVDENEGFLDIRMLKKRMVQCKSDLVEWIQVSKNLDPSSWGQLRTFGRRIKVAANKHLFDEIASRLSAHRQSLGNSLSTINLRISRDNLASTHYVKDMLSKLTEENMALAQGHDASLLGVTSRVSTYHSDVMSAVDSIRRSLSSIASHLTQRSALEGPLRSTSTGYSASVERSESDESSAKADRYSCGSLLGIESFLVDGRYCCFCNPCVSLNNSEDAEAFIDTNSFGKHLVLEHRYGECDLSKHYDTARGFSKHLLKFHSAVVYDDYTIPQLFVRAPRLPKHLRTVSGGQISVPGQTSPATTGLIATQIRELLRGVGISSPGVCSASERGRSQVKTEETRTVGNALEALWAAVDGSTSKRAVLYQVTCLLEEILVAGLELEMPLHVFEPPFYRTVASRASKVVCKLSGACQLYLRRKYPVRCPYGGMSSGFHYRRCGFCTNSVLTGSFEDESPSKFDHRMEKDKVDYFHGSLRDMTVGLNPCCFPSILPEDTWFTRVSRWMMGCFLESPNWQTLAWLSAQASSTHSARPIEDWAMEMILNWDETKDTCPAREHEDSSDGAIDSRNKSLREVKRGWVITLGQEQKPSSFAKTTRRYISHTARTTHGSGEKGPEDAGPSIRHTERETLRRNSM
ncbi:hypothetical protein QBC47DRAFT_172058 [Echria macrotheca]|uniref:Fungal N-terminal domain-containing protein n=1 Tax=Echria macrotheca TaxID=438768 RepID=A0AAJ0BGP0_9PEZI|nr:hypothetical protein QBC47DRAFT_172058 [Echria macrotheca]